MLNANRTYYLRARSRRSSRGMVLAVYARPAIAPGWPRARDAVDADYRYWTTPPHLIPATRPLALLRPRRGPGARGGERARRTPKGRSHYDRVREYFRAHDAVPTTTCGRTTTAATDTLTPLFYKGDRSMRESGFDPSDRFGPFSVDIIHYAPGLPEHAALRDGADLAAIDAALGRATEAAAWTRARRRARARGSNASCGTKRAGLYFDYDFERGQRRELPVRDHVLAAVGGAGLAGAGGAVRAQPAAVRAARAASSPARTSPATSGTRRSAGRRCSCSPSRACGATAIAADADRMARAFLLDGRRGLRAPRHASSRSTTSSGAPPTSQAGSRFGYAEQRDRLRLDQRRRPRAARRAPHLSAKKRSRRSRCRSARRRARRTRRSSGRRRESSTPTRRTGSSRAAADRARDPAA